MADLFSKLFDVDMTIELLKLRLGIVIDITVKIHFDCHFLFIYLDND